MEIGIGKIVKQGRTFGPILYGASTAQANFMKNSAKTEYGEIAIG